MKPRSIILSLILTALLTSVAVAGSFGNGLAPRHGGGPDPDDRLERMTVMLDLTEDQQAQIAEILEQSRAANEPAREQFKKDREALRAAQGADTFDQQKTRELAHKLADSRVDMMAERHQVRQKVDALLTPEQRQKKNDLRQLHEQRREQRHARHQEKRQARFY